ncbi:MAG: hypothetical protein IJY06_09500 [Oscillospiraceae bacterium]|nr:hypothetical protein [Oscillospiraceae bacterium]
MKQWLVTLTAGVILLGSMAAVPVYAKPSDAVTLDSDEIEALRLHQALLGYDGTEWKFYEDCVPVPFGCEEVKVYVKDGNGLWTASEDYIGLTPEVFGDAGAKQIKNVIKSANEAENTGDFGLVMVGNTWQLVYRHESDGEYYYADEIKAGWPSVQLSVGELEKNLKKLRDGDYAYLSKNNDIWFWADSLPENAVLVTGEDWIQDSRNVQFKCVILTDEGKVLKAYTYLEDHINSLSESESCTVELDASGEVKSFNAGSGETVHSVPTESMPSETEVVSLVPGQEETAPQLPPGTQETPWNPEELDSSAPAEMFSALEKTASAKIDENDTGKSKPREGVKWLTIIAAILSACGFLVAGGRLFFHFINK